jgi:hypothetical protein
MLTYRRSDSLEIRGYSDADYASDKDDRKSMSGYTLAGGAISWGICKQTIVASSTMYVEFIVLRPRGGDMAKEIYTRLESGRLH